MIVAFPELFHQCFSSVFCIHVGNENSKYWQTHFRKVILLPSMSMSSWNIWLLIQWNYSIRLLSKFYSLFKCTDFVFILKQYFFLLKMLTEYDKTDTDTCLYHEVLNIKWKVRAIEYVILCNKLFGFDKLIL